jgi:HK97 family phage portal protein
MANVSLVRAMTTALTIKAPVSAMTASNSAGLMTTGSGGWRSIISEGFTGAWQCNIETPIVDLLKHPTVFACVTLIASDIAKMRLELVREEENDVWVPTDNPAFSPVLRKPNHYQTWFHFKLVWMLSKLIHGNTYVLKQRDARGLVVALYVLDPTRVKPLIAPDGSVFYELSTDHLATLEESVIVPAREIIHDLFNEFYHPLVGISPLYACGIAAMLGLKIQTNSAHFFGNGSQPGGILTAPGAITVDTAKRLKEEWEKNYGGQNRGRVAVVGDGLTYEAMAESADKSQLNEQWASASQAIADAFHVPWYLVGGPQPPYNNIQALNVQYYTQCLQPLTTSFEEVMDDGLGLSPDKIGGVRLGTQFNINDLLWMDSATMMDVISKGVGAGVMKPNEGRARLNLRPVTGGDTPYLQQQYYSLADLDERSKNPQLTPPPSASATAQSEPEPESDDMPDDMSEAAFLVSMRKELSLESHP